MRRLTALIFVLFLSLNSAAELPGTIGYQGRLTDETGVPVNGTLIMTFRLFQSRQGGDPLWTEVQSAVEVDEGYFSVSLGSVTPFNLDFKSQYFLEIQVEDDDPMSPRVKLEGVPYAERAAAGPRIVVRDAAGALLGEPIGSINTSAAVLLSEAGYVFAINMGSGTVVQSQGTVAAVVFEGVDCTGSAYISMNGVGPGAVHPAGDALYYTPKSPTVVSDFIGESSISPTSDSRCSNGRTGSGPSFLTLPNDPEVTGVDVSGIEPPLLFTREQGDGVR